MVSVLLSDLQSSCRVNTGLTKLSNQPIPSKPKETLVLSLLWYPSKFYYKQPLSSSQNTHCLIFITSPWHNSLSALQAYLSAPVLLNNWGILESMKDPRKFPISCGFFGQVVLGWGKPSERVSQSFAEVFKFQPELSSSILSNSEVVGIHPSSNLFRVPRLKSFMSMTLNIISLANLTSKLQLLKWLLPTRSIKPTDYYLFTSVSHWNSPLARRPVALAFPRAEQNHPCNSLGHLLTHCLY